MQSSQNKATKRTNALCVQSIQFVLFGMRVAIIQQIVHLLAVHEIVHRTCATKEKKKMIMYYNEGQKMKS